MSGKIEIERVREKARRVYGEDCLIVEKRAVWALAGSIEDRAEIHITPKRNVRGRVVITLSGRSRQAVRRFALELLGPHWDKKSDV